MIKEAIIVWLAILNKVISFRSRFKYSVYNLCFKQEEQAQQYFVKQS